MHLKELFESNNIRNFNEILVVESMVPEELISNIIPTVSILQAIRDYIGRPIIINSTFRDKDYNRKIGGKKNSLHMKFNAIDFCPAGYKSEDLERLYEQIEDNKFLTQIVWNGNFIQLTPELMGLGLYESFIHLDTRGLLNYKAPARWVSALMNKG